MRKVCSSVLVGTLIMSSLCSCSNSNSATPTTSQLGDINIAVDDSGEIITEAIEELSWYTYDEIFYQGEYATDPYNLQMSNDFFSVKDDNFSTLLKGDRINDQGLTMFDTGFCNGFCHLIRYDYEGNQQLFCDLSAYNGFFDDTVERYVITGIEMDDEYQVITSFRDYSDNTDTYTILKIDKSTGEIISEETNDELVSQLRGKNIFYTVPSEDKIVFLTGTWGSNPPYINTPRLVVYNVVTGEVTANAMSGAFAVNNAVSLSGMYCLDNTHFAVVAKDANECPLIMMFDTDTMESNLMDTESLVANLGCNLSDVEVGSPCNSTTNVLSLKWGKHLAIFDADTMTFKEIFNTDFCNMNQTIWEWGQAGLIGMSNGSLLFADSLSNNRNYLLSLYKFDRCDSNPYAGRQLLRLSTLGGDIGYEMSDIVCSFNDSQDEVFVAIDTSYTFDEDMWVSAYFEPGATASDISAITSQLAVDLMAGDGPDILYGAFDYSELNSSNCFVDLMPYMNAGGYMDNTTFFSNMFACSQSDDGALYQVPISAGVSGLTMPYVSEDTVGFTFEEYESYLYNDWNGRDPLGWDKSQLEYFIKCFDAMSDCFIVNGQVNLDNANFYELAEFVRDNVFDRSPDDEPGEFYEPIENFRPSADEYWAAYVILGFYNSYCPTDYVTMYGIPSSDGRGPRFRTFDSLGITTSCDNTDMAAEFIQYALSYEAQSLFRMTSVRRDVVEEAMYQSVRINEAEIQRELLYDPTEAEGHIITISESAVPGAMEVYSVLADSLSGTVAGDSDIHAVLYEEMGAYFAGDRTLEELIPIMEDRAQTILDERG